MATGGFAWNRTLRDAPIAAEAIEAASEQTAQGRWAPTMILPSASAADFAEVHQAVLDVGRPYSLCVGGPATAS